MKKVNKLNFLHKALLAALLVLLVGVASTSLQLPPSLTGYQTATSCTETDGGYNPSVMGNITYTNSSGEYILSDTCWGSQVVEYACPSESTPGASYLGYNYSTRTCPFGCSSSSTNVTCITSPTTVTTSSPTTCTDTDSAGATIIRGSATTIPASGLANVTTDTCTSLTALREYYCSSPTATTVSSSTLSCPTGYRCLNGRCREPSYTCIDSDGGSIAGTRGSVTITATAIGTNTANPDTCLNSTTLREYTCSGSIATVTASNPSITTIVCPSDQTCENGACITTPASEVTYTCTDTDGGSIAGTSGTVTITPSAGTVVNTTDTCFAGSIFRVTEYTCASSTATSTTSTTLPCPSGQRCEGGACKAVTYRCVDSDGTSITTKGAVTVTPSIGGAAARTDTCTSTSTLQEYTCASSTASAPTTTLRSCSTGTTCVEGRCVTS